MTKDTEGIILPTTLLHRIRKKRKIIVQTRS